MEYIIQGFTLGVAYVAPIGMQNIYVINNAVSNTRKRAYSVALITIIFDILLAVSCFFGMGLIMEKFRFIKLGMLLIGGGAVIVMGIQLVRAKVEEYKKVDVNLPILKMAGACFLVTWGNPQALIDGSFILGGVNATLPVEASKYFITGVCIASTTWFMGLTTVFSIFKNKIKPEIIRGINIICGCVLIYYGAKLVNTFITEVF